MTIFIYEDKIKNKFLEKYNLDFREMKNISTVIKSKYYISDKMKLLFDLYINQINLENNENLSISEKCIKRYKFIEEKEFSYVENYELYKKIEQAYVLWYFLENIICLEILWNKEITQNYDNDYQYLSTIAKIYLKETDDLIKELGGISNETKEDTNENVCCNKRKI